MTKLKSESFKEPPIPPSPTGLRVSAYLVYNDSTISTFDILNDKTIVLWNTIIGAGDAKKPSEQTKIELTGKLDSLKIMIYNGKKIIENRNLPDFSGSYEFIIKNTGCEKIKVIVTKQNRVIYQGDIPFKCGE